MLTPKDRREAQKSIEKTRLNRVANLRALMEMYGGWVELGRQCGRQPTFLVALAGPNPRREIGEKLARAIEAELRLPAGTLDTPRR